MARHLVFTLYGPLQAWGTVAVGEIRPCAGHPTRSGVLGLLAAALGIRRGEDDRLRALSDAYGVAVRVDDPGDRFTDYHTIQTPQEKRKRIFRSRRDELGGMLGPHEKPNTILSRRDYLTDARFTVCLRARGDDAQPPLEELREALESPRLTPYLGRKSCPPGLPFMPRIIEADDALAALDAYAPFAAPGKAPGADAKVDGGADEAEAMFDAIRSDDGDLDASDATQRPGGADASNAANAPGEADASVALGSSGAKRRIGDADACGAAGGPGGPGSVSRPPWRRSPMGDEADVFCDEGMCPGEPLERLVARDVVDDHARRAFGTRLECRHRMPANRGGA